MSHIINSFCRSREEDMKQKKFHSPINSVQQLMAITAEECGELTQICMKIMRKYNSINDIKNDTEWNEKLVEEAGDVMCMLELMVENGLLTNEQINARIQVKRNKLKTWSSLVDSK